MVSRRNGVCVYEDYTFGHDRFDSAYNRLRAVADVEKCH